MPTINLSLPVADTGVTAGLHATNYLVLQTLLNGGLDDNNISSITQAKITFTSFASFTPTWTSSGVAPAIGNGTLAGRYMQIGKLVFFEMNFVAGGTTTYGTGNYSFALPVTANVSLVTGLPVGTAIMFDSSTGNQAYPVAYVNAAGTLGFQYPAASPIGAGTIVSQTAPWAWASGDLIRASGVYEAA